MNAELRNILDAGGGVATRTALLEVVSRHVIAYAVQAGALRRIFPRVYADPARLVEPATRARAALAYAGPGAALSHLTALGVWGLPGGDLVGPVHVLVEWPRRRYAAQGVVLHRRSGFAAAAPEVVVRGGMPTSRVERCVVDSWPLLSADTRRAAVINAVGERRTTPDRLLVALGAQQSLPGRAELVRLINLLERGCRSELELWGYTEVFTGTGMPAVEWNVPLRIGDRTVYLDAYCRAARVNFELDGAKHHSSAADRQRDARRDAALAAMGIMVVRFTHDQLVNHPEQVRAQICAIVAARLHAMAGVVAMAWGGGDGLGRR